MHGRALRLADAGEQFAEPRGCGVERFAALDARELDGAEDAAAVFVVTDHAAFATERAFDGEVGAALDEAEIVGVGGGGAGEVAGFLDERFFGAEHLGELVAEPFAGIDGVEFHVTKGVARDFLALGLHLGDDGLHAGAFADEDVHVVDAVHDPLEAGGFGGEVDGHLGDEHGVHLEVGAGETEAGNEFLAVEEFAVVGGGGGGEPATVAAHDLVDDEHARVGVVLGDDVAEVARALFGGGPGAEGLADRIHVVVDRLGETDDGERIVVLREEGGEVGGGGVGVVAADGVENVDAVLDELVGGGFLRVLALLDEAALHAVFDVGEFDAAVADGAAAVAMEEGGGGALGGADFVAVAEEEAFVAAAVGDEFDVGRDFGVTLNESADGGAEAGREATGGEEGDFLGTSWLAHGVRGNTRTKRINSAASTRLDEPGACARLGEGGAQEGGRGRDQPRQLGTSTPSTVALGSAGSAEVAPIGFWPK